MTKKQNNNNQSKCKILQFPKNKTKTEKLTESDINSLFLGLVKLAKQNVGDDNNLLIDSFLKHSYLHNQREIISSYHKQKQIDFLTKQIANLKKQNQILQNKLIKYRINYVFELHNNNK